MQNFGTLGQISVLRAVYMLCTKTILISGRVGRGRGSGVVTYMYVGDSFVIPLGSKYADL